jgi:hypothetical protein
MTWRDWKYFFEMFTPFVVDLYYNLMCKISDHQLAPIFQNNYYNSRKWPKTKKRSNAFHSNRTDYNTNICFSMYFLYIFSLYFINISFLSYHVYLREKFKCYVYRLINLSGILLTAFHIWKEAISRFRQEPYGIILPKACSR